MQGTDDRHPAPTDKRATLTAERLGLAACDLYVAGVVAYLTLRYTTGGRLWPVAAGSILTPWLLIPAIPLTAALLIARRWWRAVFSATGVLAFLVLFGALFLPSVPGNRACAAQETPCRQLRIMTYNLLNDSVDTAGLIAYLREQQPDIVMLQEVGPRAATDLASELSDLYPYQVHYPEGIPGIGLLSRHPIHEEQVFYPPEYLSLPYETATILVDGMPLEVFNAHPPPPGTGGPLNLYVARNSEAIRLLTRQIDTDSPTILAGDFNTSDQTVEYRMLERAGLQDAFRQCGTGLGLTWPAPAWVLPAPLLVRMDMIWVTDHFDILTAWVGPDFGADHLPVLADLRWQRIRPVPRPGIDIR